ncbi:YkgJ family cysteine cluster protein [Stenotrophomonas sp. MYb238]|uniref:YkgJ family cysteine cluster protein n=1 Tax=Stenotrophomonas sp. MYb238 TaxID=2040281 RepID=UPI0012917EDF|nr:YkgJ family cysteine cluster protein [Stenotrophomonas sp. MYb238]MQP74848.1 YkgJ family cysteine cluster protein [Stenotrophomonas sp. MYb238]
MRHAGRQALNPSTRRTPSAVRCTSCDAVCCRLTVVLGSEDVVPEHLTTRLHGLRVMARDPEGWCVAVDGQRMNCRIHASRPAVCRSFVMGGPYCRSVREEYARPASGTIESTLA